MKVTIDIDCTPEEARRFFGLPDVSALQHAVAEQMQERMAAGWKPDEMEALMQQWLGGGAAGIEALRRMFRGSSFGGGGKTE